MAFTDLPEVNSTFIVEDVADTNSVKMIKILAYSDNKLAVFVSLTGNVLGGAEKIWLIVADADTDFPIVDEVSNANQIPFY